MGDYTVDLNVNGPVWNVQDAHALTWYGSHPTGYQAGCRCGWWISQQVDLITAVLAHGDHKLAEIEFAELDQDPVVWGPA